MPALSLANISIAFICYVAFKLLSNAWRTHQFKKFAQANGCEEPFDNSGTGPFAFLDGWRKLRRVLQMAKTKEDILDDIMADTFKDSWTPRQTQFEGTVNLATIEPANLQAMLATQFKDFVVGQRRINQFYPLLGNSIFSSDDTDWEHARALFRPQFNREQINDLEETEEAAKALIEALGPVDSAGWTKGSKLLPLLYNFTLDTATAFLFGETVGSQRLTMSSDHAQNQVHLAASRQFMKDFELAGYYMLLRIRNQSLYWLADGWAFRSAAYRIKAFTEQFVRRALSPTPQADQPASDDEKKKKKYNLLSALATETSDHHELRNQTLAILLAGRDTTASLLAWCFTRLALHPAIFARLRAAVHASFPPHAHEAISFAALKSCRPLQHFLNEVLRLHASVPVNNRTAARDTTLPVGGGPDQTAPVAVRRGQVVMFSVYLMHRRADLWGPDVLEFRPERWAEQKIPAWQFLPFSGGPRICLGQQFALTEASYVLVRMLQHFDGIEPMDYAAEAKMRKGIGLTMYPTECRVRFHRA